VERELVTTLRQKIGQMLVIGFDGTEINEASPVSQWLGTDGLGGVLLFDYDLVHNKQGKNLLNKSQITHLTQQLKFYSQKTIDLPLFIALDYEGGAVDRLKTIDDCMLTMTAKELGEISPEQAHRYTQQMADTLKNLGFNLNFAPVVDLDLNNQEGIIGKLGRSFSSDSRKVVQQASAFVKTFAERGLTCCYKHFPGHGSAVGDTHHGFVDVTDTFQNQELEPYRYLAAPGEQPAMIMTAHVINRNLDDSGLPATLSYKILTDLLRRDIGFDGVIISDDLQMHAISQHYTVEEALTLTINAGADMVIFGNQLGTVSATEIIDTIEQLVKTNSITLARIEQAFQRIINLKQPELVNA